MKELKIEEGSKYDKNKLRVDLLSFQALQGIAEILTFGAKKYGDRNWEKGLSFSRVLSVRSIVEISLFKFFAIFFAVSSFFTNKFQNISAFVCVFNKPNKLSVIFLE